MSETDSTVPNICCHKAFYCIFSALRLASLASLKYSSRFPIVDLKQQLECDAFLHFAKLKVPPRAAHSCFGLKLASVFAYCTQLENTKMPKNKNTKTERCCQS